MNKRTKKLIAIITINLLLLGSILPARAAEEDKKKKSLNTPTDPDRVYGGFIGNWLSSVARYGQIDEI